MSTHKTMEIAHPVIKKLQMERRAKLIEAGRLIMDDCDDVTEVEEPTTMRELVYGQET